MVTYSEYLKNILIQIRESYAGLENGNKRDLDFVNKEMLKINGMIRVVLTKIRPTDIPLSDFSPLRSKMRHYIETYSFEKEISTMSSLYSGDAGRVNNMRLKIIEALNDKRMMESVGEMIDKL